MPDRNIVRLDIPAVDLGELVWAVPRHLGDGGGSGGGVVVTIVNFEAIVVVVR